MDASKGVDSKFFRRAILLALDEDCIMEDITSQFFILRDNVSKIVCITREDGILCGMKVVRMLCAEISPDLKYIFHHDDGDFIFKEDIVFSISGNTRLILAMERVCLNFVQHLSGVSTMTHRFVSLIKHTQSKIYDTRKTIPGLRHLQKYAVKCGGGYNHRMNLKEMFMIKDNHIAYGEQETLRYRISKIKKDFQDQDFILETDSEEQVLFAIQMNVPIILLDNFSFSDLQRFIPIIRHQSKSRIEVSGKINIDTVSSIAELGVDRISVGALTHSSRSLDMSFEFSTT